MGSELVLRMTVLLLLHGYYCGTPERLASRLGHLSERLDAEILARRDEAKLLKDKVQFVQGTLNKRSVDFAKDGRTKKDHPEDVEKKYDNLAAALKRGFAAEKRFNERVRRNVAALETSVNGLFKDQMGIVRNLSDEISFLRENIAESSGNWKVCSKEMHRLKEQIHNIPEEVSSVLDFVKYGQFISEMHNIDKRIDAISEKVNAIFNMVKFEFRNRSCEELLSKGQLESGLYDIHVYPNGQTPPIRVYCDQETDGGGWTVFQRRQDGTVDFYRGWDDYKHGFGDKEGEHWLGNENIWELTRSGKHELRIDMEDFAGVKRFAKYAKFKIGSESELYNLSLGRYTGDAGDSLEEHDGMLFTTKDRDNDRYYEGHCSERFKGGWWYNTCHRANLNGLYLHGENKLSAQGINWFEWHGYHYSLKFVEMKIR